MTQRILSSSGVLIAPGTPFTLQGSGRISGVVITDCGLSTDPGASSSVLIDTTTQLGTVYVPLNIPLAAGTTLFAFGSGSVFVIFG